ncbi:TPA: solute:sodium symporter family transporter, partial [Staphylococcus pseudintermedius]|nr:solute:sodium symporter family transporter [Staphylococcus pseudintermedius]
LIFNKIKPSNAFDFDANYAKVDITPWKHRYVVGIIIIIIVIVTYTIFSPLVLAGIGGN